jgi:hypothetical protein
VSKVYFSTGLISYSCDASTSFKRGIRLLNKRRQVLLQDEITASQPIMWRAHTNATVTVGSNGTSATFQIGDQTMTMQVLSPTSGIQIAIGGTTRQPNDPPLPEGAVDSPNPGVTVVSISLPAGTYNLQVLFNPQWSGMSQSDFVTPPSVDLDNWDLTSHN